MGWVLNMKRTIGVLICVLVLVNGLSMNAAAEDMGSGLIEVSPNNVDPQAFMGTDLGWTWDSGLGCWVRDWDISVDGTTITVDVYAFIQDSCNPGNTMDAVVSVTLRIWDLFGPGVDTDNWEPMGAPPTPVTFDGTYNGQMLFDDWLQVSLANCAVNDVFEVDIIVNGDNHNDNPPTLDLDGDIGLITCV